MSNASLKDQLQAVVSQLSETIVVKTPNREQKPSNSVSKSSKPSKRALDLKSDRASAPKPKWLIYMQYGVELLRTYFPTCFKDASEVKPLKKGIKQDLIKQLSTMERIVTEDKACMVQSLAYYVNTVAYHKSVVEGAERIDLEGNPAGIVTAEEAKYSYDRHQAKLHDRQNAPKASQGKSAQAKDEVT